MEQVELVQILRRVVDSPPASNNAANEIEGRLLAIDRDVPEIEEFLCALAAYEPTDHPTAYMFGFDGLRSAANGALHDLNVHDNCLHDAPLMDRP